MKYTTSNSGIVYPVEEKKKADHTKAWHTYTFHVYYFQDLPKYLNLLDKEGACLISVSKDIFRSGLNAGYVIVYNHDEPVDMEVLC
jgi:hypothetical protein